MSVRKEKNLKFVLSNKLSTNFCVMLNYEVYPLLCFCIIVYFYA